MRSCKALCLAALLVLTGPCLAEDWDVMPQGDIAGPVVKQTNKDAGAKTSKNANTAATTTDAAATTDTPDAAAKKTIAQMLDEALEQEFPKEAEATQGKNYNETAKKEEVGIFICVYVVPYINPCCHAGHSRDSGQGQRQPKGGQDSHRVHQRHPNSSRYHHWCAQGGYRRRKHNHQTKTENRYHCGEGGRPDHRFTGQRIRIIQAQVRDFWTAVPRTINTNHTGSKAWGSHWIHSSSGT